MADSDTPNVTSNPFAVIPVPPVSAPQPLVMAGPAHWKAKRRPAVIIINDDRVAQLYFDVYFAGAAATGRWEDEWPLMTEDEFVSKLEEAASVEIGGQWPDGTHSRGANSRTDTAKAGE